MTVRTTAIGLLALVGGLVLIAASDGSPATAVGLALTVVGAGVTLVALLRGTHQTADAALRSAEADAARTDGAARHTRAAADTGRWPRIIGGG